MITRQEIKEYKNLLNLVNKSIIRINEIDEKIPKNTFGGGNYKKIPVIIIKEMPKEEFKDICFFDTKDSVLSEYDKDFYNAKDKIDLDIINEKIRLELYKI